MSVTTNPELEAAVIRREFEILDFGQPDRIEVNTLEEFAAVDEPGAEPILGGADTNLIPEGGDVMVYGEGGAGKTTFTLDGGFHLGAGVDWLWIQGQTGPCPDH